MKRTGQDTARPLERRRARLDDDGFVLVALLVGMAVAAIWMSTLLPSWRQQAVRQQEEELIFRGEQYARAIALYRRKTGSLPPNFDVLVSQHYLRRQYLDPITGKAFLPVGGATGAAAASSPGAVATMPSGTGLVSVGITGVRSTSNDTSIKIYNNQQTYSQWAFDWTAAAQRMGDLSGLNRTSLPGGLGHGGRGGRGTELPPIEPRGGALRGGPGGGGRGATPPGAGRGGFGPFGPGGGAASGGRGGG
jgi:type II secretory pathway pseudopilin PulG